MDNNEIFDEKLNMDTASSEKIAETSEKLITHLKEQDELVAAEHVEYLVGKTKEEKSEPKKPDPNLSKILVVNKGILRVLEKIHEDMIDEQDTSIKKGERLSVSDNLRNLPEEAEELEKSETGFDLGLGFGRFGKPRLPGKTQSRKSASKKAPSKKAPSKVSKEPQKTKPKTKPKAPKISGLGKTGAGALGKLGKGALNLGRVGGKLFLPLALGLSAYDAFQGWSNASEILDTPEEEITTAQKLATATGSLVSGLSFGLLDTKDVSKNIIDAFKDDEAEKEEVKTNKHEYKRELTEFEKETIKNSENTITQITEKIITIEKQIQEQKEIIENSANEQEVEAAKQTVQALSIVQGALQTNINNELNVIKSYKNIDKDESENSEVYKFYNEKNIINNTTEDKDESITEKVGKAEVEKSDSEKIIEDHSELNEVIKQEQYVKITPIKTSSITSQNTINNNSSNFIEKNSESYIVKNKDIQVNRNIREQIIDNTTNNLNKQTNIYNSNIASSQARMIVEPIINSNIQNISNKEQEQFRPLSLFSG